MAQNVDHALLQEARRADLYDFCIRNHADGFTREGNSLRPIWNHSISIKQGYSGYKDFSSDETGNAIDFLTRYLGYDIIDAVFALTGTNTQAVQKKCKKQAVFKAEKQTFQLPPAINGPYTQLFAYLNKTRKIPGPVIQKMIDHHILYQEQEHNNAVFVNVERTMYEMTGTLSGSRFKQVQYKDNQSAFWWFKSGSLKGKPSGIFVCESAIDAMSLFAIHAYQHAIKPVSSVFMDTQKLYISMSGVANTQKIDLLMQHRSGPVFLEFAVDNDDAGRALYEKYKGKDIYITSLFPPEPYKDWNDVLQAEIDHYEAHKTIDFMLPKYK